MDSSVFQTDSVKLDSISRLLRQADEMLAEVTGHLGDYAARLNAQLPRGDLAETHRLEVERLQQAVMEKEDEARAARTERVSALDEVKALRERVRDLELQLEAAGKRSNGDVNDRAEAQNLQRKFELQTSALQMANRRLQDEVEHLTRRLKEAHSQIERLLRTREELLDTLKLGDVTVMPPPVGAIIAVPARPRPEL